MEIFTQHSQAQAEALLKKLAVQLPPIQQPVKTNEEGDGHRDTSEKNIKEQHPEN